MPKPTTGTDSVSSRSSVAPTSRIDFTPAQTTTIGVDARPARSADSSNVVGRLAVDAARGRRWRTRGCPPGRRCGRCWRRWSPRAAADEARAEVAQAELVDVERGGDRLQRVRVEPDAHPPRPRPRWWPAPRPPSARRPRSRAATRRLSGRGRPWAMIVDSSATTGRPRRQGGGHLLVDRDHQMRAGCQTVRISQNAIAVRRSSAPPVRTVRFRFSAARSSRSAAEVGRRAGQVDQVDVVVVGEPGQQLRVVAGEQVDDAAGHVGRGDHLPEGARDESRGAAGQGHDRVAGHDRRAHQAPATPRTPVVRAGQGADAERHRASRG